jgi:hypothetical protein
MVITLHDTVKAVPSDASFQWPTEQYGILSQLLQALLVRFQVLFSFMVVDHQSCVTNAMDTSEKMYLAEPAKIPEEKKTTLIPI